MDDPTKDTIPRSAVEYCLRKETVSTNPEKYKTHEKFIDYMNDPDISEFGHWMHSNGFNCALTAISVDLKKIPSVTPSAQPGWIPTSEKLPEGIGQAIVQTDGGAIHEVFYKGKNDYGHEVWMRLDGDIYWDDEVVAWMPLPTPYLEGGPDESDD